MSTSAAATPPVRSIRPTALKRLIARICRCEESEFVLQIVQPSLVGMIDGTVSTLAPIFAAAVSSNSRTALLVGLATALGAGVSMGFSEALSDTGEQTGRGSAIVRGAITGAATTLGGVFHSLPFIITNVNQALAVAGIVVAIELVAIAGYDTGSCTSRCAPRCLSSRSAAPSCSRSALRSEAPDDHRAPLCRTASEVH